jgi:tetratricopeptide (TPR) repeat protein
MYLQWGKNNKALEYFMKSYKLGKQMGGLAVAEPANNMSKVWSKLGNRKKELQYLQEALPILESFYGSEHPKVVEAKSRME